tara:strand:+ start:645 stop:890 length:246 start_codon:yes stop_codon:yes gene_type:complete
MTEEYDNTNRGVLFKNDFKRDNEKAPDMTGTINVDGVEKNIAAWKKVTQKGKPMLSIAVSEKQESSSNAPVPSNDDDFLDF